MSPRRQLGEGSVFKRASDLDANWWDDRTMPNDDGPDWERDADGKLVQIDPRTGRRFDWTTSVPPCRLGREEYDGARYCFEHAGFLEAGVQGRRCDRA